MNVNDAIEIAVKCGYDEVHENATCAVCVAHMGFSRSMVTIEDSEQFEDITFEGKKLDYARESNGITINGVPAKQWKEG